MRIEWDAKKAASNIRKHGIDFADAIIALEDENALTIEDIDHDELRFKTVGMGSNLSVLYVVHTILVPDCIRIISARNATRSEIKCYYRGLINE